MRILFAMLGCLALAQCAGGDRGFRVGASPEALVIIGVAETSDHRDPRYSLLWRRLRPDGTFTSYDDVRAINARTHAENSTRIEGIPGEFEIFRVEPGAYALDSAYATLRENGVTYTAQGVVVGPERPAFEVRAGEAVYLGIWEMDVDGARAVTRLWRLNGDDLHAVQEAARGEIVGAPRVLEVETRSTPCAPRRMGQTSSREIC